MSYPLCKVSEHVVATVPPVALFRHLNVFSIEVADLDL